jgi:hypothetical protein
MSGVGAKSSCVNLFKKQDILPVSHQYILSLMVSGVDKQKNFQTNLSVHGLDTRNKISCICLLQIFHVFREVSPTLLQKNIENLGNESVQFATVPCKHLVSHSFYSLAEFFKYPIQIIDTVKFNLPYIVCLTYYE